MSEKYFVHFIPLPPHIEGVTMPNDDDTFEIYINANLCPSRQEKALNHELNHIKKDHFYDDIKPIETVETEAG